MKKTLFTILLLIIGFIFIYIDLYNKFESRIGEKEIIYRYIPKTPTEELEQEIFPSEIFETMFSQPSPWINSVNELDLKNRENINKYYISQI
jgi:hypothetical protein